MANEATWINRNGDTNTHALSFTVANGTAISKGTLLVLSGDRTAIASSAINQVFLGVANQDKEASDGLTRIGADVIGVFDMTCVASPATALPQAGDIVEISGANLIRRINPRGISGAEFISGAMFAFGRALETASASEVIAV